MYLAEINVNLTLGALLCVFMYLVAVQGYAVGISKYGRIEKYPYQVLLIGKQFWRKKVLCGGTLLDNQWVLTAGHCTIGVTQFDVHLGARYFDVNNDPGHLIVKTNKFIVHEDFDPNYPDNDIALVKLLDPVRFTHKIQPATLPNLFKYENFTGNKVVASGWGTIGDQPNSGAMQYTDLEVISNDECFKDYNEYIITDKVLCAKGLNDETVCSGDSGGPLVLKDSQIVIGVTSFGPIDGCETQRAGGFTRVTSYLDWINEKTGTRRNIRFNVGDNIV